METRAQFGAVPRAVFVLALIALLTLVTATAIAIGASTPAKLPPPFGPAGNGLIAYVSDGDIWVVEADGSGLRQITSGADEEGGPSWSRDGTQLAYWSSAGDGPSHLIVTDAEGADPVVVASVDGDVNGETWSADGSEIMYSAVVPGLGSDPCPVLSSQGGACGSRLFVAPVDGSGSRPVGDPDLDARGPALSPDGWTVAFGGGEAASEALFLMSWDGSDVRRLETELPISGWAFAKQSWSVEGDTIVTHDGAGRQGVWLVEADGSNATKVGFGSYWPTYAPDGSAVVWATNLGPSIWTPGADPESITIPADDLAWAPDATKLVGVGIEGLFIVDREGQEVAVLGPADDEALAWQRVAD